MLAATAGLTVGFLVGLLSFRVKRRLCWRCGDWITRHPGVWTEGKDARRV
jgi:hypothetical protein